MAIWKPASSIGPQERLGRRLFDEPTLVGATDQAPLKGLNLRHFRDNREPTLSLDRMGRTNVEKQVAKYLNIRGFRAASKRKAAFQGWVEVAAKEITNPAQKGAVSLLVVSSPVHAQPCDMDNNNYHCHVEKPTSPEPYYIELQLRHIFTDRGRIHYSEAPEEVAPEENWFAKATGYIRNCFRRLRRWGT